VRRQRSPPGAGTPAREANARRIGQRLAGRVEGARTPDLLPLAVRPGASLTQREREIALLAAGGMTSQAIAATLTVSVRTIENHLQRIYSKLGLRSRRELGEAL
jgi:DNA-binding CsgD family transcriptional regulator